MTVKNLGHYEGEILEISSKDVQYLDDLHRELYNLYCKKCLYETTLETINDKIKSIKEEIKPLIEKKQINWAWIEEIKRTSIKWKEEFINELGEKKAEEVTEKYKTKTYPHVRVRYIDPEPDTIKLKPEYKKPKRFKLKIKK